VIVQCNWFAAQAYGLAVFFRATAATAVARLSHRNSVRLSDRHTDGSVKNGAN